MMSVDLIGVEQLCKIYSDCHNETQRMNTKSVRIHSSLRVEVLQQYCVRINAKRSSTKGRVT